MKHKSVYQVNIGFTIITNILRLAKIRLKKELETRRLLRTSCLHKTHVMCAHAQAMARMDVVDFEGEVGSASGLNKWYHHQHPQFMIMFRPIPDCISRLHPNLVPHRLPDCVPDCVSDYYPHPLPDNVLEGFPDNVPCGILDLFLNRYMIQSLHEIVDSRACPSTSRFPTFRFHFRPAVRKRNISPYRRSAKKKLIGPIGCRPVPCYGV